MERFTIPFSRFSLKCVKVILLLLSALLFFTSFLTSSYAYMDTQQMLFAADNLFLSVLGMLLSLSFLYLLISLSQRSGHFKHFLLGVVMILFAVCTCVLVVFNRSVPGADPMTVFRIAEEFAGGNLRAIHPSDSYLSYYPHQIGLVAYEEILLRIWKHVPGDVVGYHFIKLVDLCLAEVMLVCLYKIVRGLFEEEKNQIVYLFLMLLHFPLLFYITFIYGEVPSASFFFIGLFFLMKLLKKQEMSRKKLLLCAMGSLVCFSLSVTIRKNMLVLMIAVFLVLLFMALSQKRYWLLLLGGLYLFGTLATPRAVLLFYEMRAGSYLNDGVPALAFIAMGMQYADRGNGWYNGYNFVTYENAGLDAAEASAVAGTYIRERLTYFLGHLPECLRFYFDKFRSQWCDGTYACLQATLAEYGGRSRFFEDLYAYNGYAYKVFLFLCNTFQNLLYLGNFIFCLSDFRKEGKKFGFPHYLCLIGVLGIFLFHMLWEANSRYVFHSGLLLLPGAAYGLGRLLTAVKQIKKIKRKQ